MSNSNERAKELFLKVIELDTEFIEVQEYLSYIHSKKYTKIGTSANKNNKKSSRSKAASADKWIGEKWF